MIRQNSKFTDVSDALKAIVGIFKMRVILQRHSFDLNIQ